MKTFTLLRTFGLVVFSPFVFTGIQGDPFTEIGPTDATYGSCVVGQGASFVDPDAVPKWTENELILPIPELQFKFTEDALEKLSEDGLNKIVQHDFVIPTLLGQDKLTEDGLVKYPENDTHEATTFQEEC